MARADMSYLEWNGPTLRVRVRVSPKARPIIGKHFLKVSLGHGSMARAQGEKHKIVDKLRQQIRDAEREAARRAGASPEELYALDLRERRRDDERELEKARKAFLALPRAERERLGAKADEISDEERLAWTLADEVDVAVDAIDCERGDAAARAFAAIVYGTATPLRAFLANYLKASNRDAKSNGMTRRAVSRLEQWCIKTGTAQTLEAITPRVAADFEEDAFPPADVSASTFQSYRSALCSYWDWLIGRGAIAHGAVNPWRGRRARQAKQHRREDALRKRPFSDDEVARLLAGVEDHGLHPLTMSRRLLDVMLMAALSGMRLSEIAGLRVKHVDVNDGCFVIAKGKTVAGVRRVPVHSLLGETVSRLTKGKGADDYLVAADLADPPDGAERGRGGPLSKAFTRYRRKLGIDERAGAHPQSAVDFHSFRRWFIRKRTDALEQGAVGWSAWTLADVVGHDKEEMPLAMTMSRYPGAASLNAKRACVESAGLPSLGGHKTASATA